MFGCPLIKHYSVCASFHILQCILLFNLAVNWLIRLVWTVSAILLDLLLVLFLIILLILFFLLLAYLTQNISIKVWFDAVELVQHLIIEVLLWNFLILFLHL